MNFSSLEKGLLVQHFISISACDGSKIPWKGYLDCIVPWAFLKIAFSFVRVRWEFGDWTILRTNTSCNYSETVPTENNTRDGGERRSDAQVECFFPWQHTYHKVYHRISHFNRWELCRLSRSVSFFEQWHNIIEEWIFPRFSTWASCRKLLTFFCAIKSLQITNYSWK